MIHKRNHLVTRKRKAMPIALSLALGFMLASSLSPTRQANAQEPPSAEPGIVRAENLEMAVKAGFGKLRVNSSAGNWVPFRITIANQGQPINGRVVVHCESPPTPSQPTAHEYVKQINLPTGSRQTIEVAVFLQAWETPTIRIINGNDTVIAETSLTPERSYGYGQDQDLEIAVVDTDITALNNITATQIIRAPNREPFKKARAGSAQQTAGTSTQPGSSAASSQSQSPPSGQPRIQGPRQRQVGPSSNRPTFKAQTTVIAPEDLPRDYVSFDPVDAVVIGDAPLNQLSKDQVRALRLWVASGGLLIVTGGADMTGMNAVGFEDMLPIEARATSSASASSLPELTEVYGQFESGDGLTTMAARAKSGARVLIGTNDRPIVAERNYGSGLVRFVAINPKLNPYRGWLAAKDLWSDLLLPAADTKPRNIDWITNSRRRGPGQSRWGIQTFLFRQAEVVPPSPNFFLLFLLIYVLVVGPANYFLLRWKRKTDLGWLTIPAVVLLFTAVSVAIAQVSRGSQSVISDASIVELHQRDGITRSHGGLLVMPASKGTQEVTFEGRDAYAHDVFNGNQPSSASASGTIESEREQTGFTLRVPMTTWTSGLFQLRSISEGAQPMVSAAQSADGTVTIKNLGNAQMNNAVYLSASGVSDLFELAPGGEQKITLKSPQAVSFNRWYGDQLGQETDEADVFWDLTALLDRQIGGDQAFMQDISQGFFENQMMVDALKRLERPLVICFSDKQPGEIKFDKSFKRRSKAFYVIHL